ncbi:MAG TPA: hypothetical protein VN029_10940, partial [Sphingomonas sp.]|nr:hypothetical protein [Sphingomonas sp.]
MRGLPSILAVSVILLAPAGSAAVPAPAEDGRIASDADFDRMARVEGNSRFLELPRVMFAIDRSGARPRVLWIDTRRYQYHFDYLQARYLTLADADKFTAANYSKADRRFVLGAVVRYPRLGRYGVELWEGDVVEPELLAMTMRELQASFHAPLTFKPNSGQQADRS